MSSPDHKNLSDRLIRAAFNGKGEEGYNCEQIKKRALNGNAAEFKQLLSDYGHNPTYLEAIVAGFEKDEDYHREPRVDTPYSVPQNHADLEKKRDALREFVLKNKPAVPDYKR